MVKKRIVKDYEALPAQILEDLKLKYPNGYADHLVSYSDKVGKKVSALPFETDEAYFLIRMTVQEAKRLLREEEDLEEDVVLKEEIQAVEVGDEFDGEGEGDDEMVDGTSDEDDHIIVTRRRDDDDIPDDSEY